MDVSFLYITFPNEKEAEDTGEKLVKEKLAACCNIISSKALSIYYWEKELVKEREVVMIAKTASDKVQKLTDRITQLHSYDVPCVVALPVNGGNREFIDWVKKEVE